MNSRSEQNSVGRVSRFTPTSVSCTILIRGLLNRGLIIWFATAAISRSSTAASTDCGACKFISIVFDNTNTRRFPAGVDYTLSNIRLAKSSYVTRYHLVSEPSPYPADTYGFRSLAADPRFRPTRTHPLRFSSTSSFSLEPIEPFSPILGVAWLYGFPEQFGSVAVCISLYTTTRQLYLD